MSRSLKIAGDERITDLEKRSLSIQQALTYEIDTCSFSVKGDAPTEGEEVIIEDGGTRHFAGIITKVESSRSFYDRSIKVWKVDCDDYTALLDRLLVVESYNNMSASAIFLDIIEKYCPGFTGSGVQAGAPNIEYIPFDDMRPSECFRELCNYVGWHWMPDYYKDLKFFSAEALSQPAPMELETNGSFVFGKHTVNTQGLRNQVKVKGGKMLSDAQNISWKADGAARIWTLPWEPNEASIKVIEVPQNLGIESVDEDDGTYDYFLNPEDKYIRCSKFTDTPVDGATMTLTAKQGLRVITIVDDYDSQAAMALVQGGDGVYQHVIVEDSLTTLEAAEALGNMDLREHANPRVSGSFSTEVPGWSPGQLVTINLDDRGVQGTYLIQKVNISLLSIDVVLRSGESSRWSYSIQYGGRLLGQADILKSLVSAQQKKKLGETSTIDNIKNYKETVSVSDELELIDRTPPWYCGDEDAVCGFVECSGFFQIVAADGIGILNGFEGPK